jgi:hypothetical protein
MAIAIHRKKYMKKFLVSIVLIGLWLVLLSYLYALLHRISAKPPRLNPIVRLVRDNRTFCTGTVVDAYTIITAAHCVAQQSLFEMSINYEPIEIRAEDDRPIKVSARVYEVRMQLDQAILVGNFPMFEPKKIITDINELKELRVPGKKYMSCGYPLYGDLYCGETTYLHVTDFFISISGVLLPGMSGGPTMLPNGTMIAVNNAVTGDESIVSPIYNIDNIFPSEKDAK